MKIKRDIDAFKDIRRLKMSERSVTEFIQLIVRVAKTAFRITRTAENVIKMTATGGDQADQVFATKKVRGSNP